MSTFEWRPNNGSDAVQETTTEFDTLEGCLFACSGKQTTMNPSLTMIPPTPIAAESFNNGVQPTAGDDLSPPNAVDASKMNGIAVPVSATAGWSQSPPKTEGVYPSCVSYDLRLLHDDSLELAVSLEYTNPRPKESMMVNVAVAKTLVNAEMGTELALVATQFQEFVQDKWIDITADVDYTQTANAVVDAVLSDPNAGQTAGKATVTAKTVELTLGPFVAKARLNLIFQADQLYTYEAMSVRDDAADIGTHRLLPLWVTLPFAPVHHEAGLSNLAVRLQAPPGTSVLPMEEFREAYQDLKQQEIMEAITVLAVSDLSPQPIQRTVGFQFRWESLPFRSTGILAWLALPNPVEDPFDFVHIGRSLAEMTAEMTAESHNKNNLRKEQTQARIQVPTAEDVSSLQVPLPGHGPMGSLYRVKVKMPQAQPRQQPLFILNLTLSDRSGSTSMRVRSSDGASSAVTMRQRFNELAEVRFLKRLESIPALVQAGVLQMDDVWMDAFLAFDSAAPASSIHRVVIRVRNVHDHIVEVVQAIRDNNTAVATNKLPMIFRHVQALRGIRPGGATDFSVGPRTLIHSYAQWKKEAQSLLPAGSGETKPCTFVEFDTDGGHNGAPGYLDIIRSFCKAYDVRDGVVTGFGSWLNQDCASKVAKVLGSLPALLSLQVPQTGSEGLDKVFRTGFSAWIGALRRPPALTLKVSAGCVSFASGASSRNANAVELLAVRRVGERFQPMVAFGPPDVSDETFTKAVVTNVPAGEELLLYLVSRLDGPAELAQRLEILSGVEGAPSDARTKGQVENEEEAKRNSFLAYDWLKMLTTLPGKVDTLQHAPLMSTSLASRLEDEMSFRFNIASPSGKTSFLGRCKTVANRAPIDAAHQPGKPSCPLTVEAPASGPKRHRHNGPLLKGRNRGRAGGRAGGRGGGGGRTSGPPPPPGTLYASRGPPMPLAAAPAFRSSAAPQPPAGTTAFGAPAAFSSSAPSRPDGFHSSASDAGLQMKYSASVGPFANHRVSLTMDDDVGEETTRRVGVLASFPPSNISFQPPPMTGAMAPLAASASMASSSARSSRRHKCLANSTERRRRASVTMPSACNATQPTPPQKPKEPSWMDALAVPVGSSKPLTNQGYDELLQAMNEVVHARRRLDLDPRVNFVCDICTRQFAPGQARYHCYDCQDLDACANCRGRHNMAFHRMALINPSATPSSTVSSEDPLVGSLLGSNPAASASDLLAQPLEVDQTVEWSKRRVARFLLAVLHWWPVFRASCVFREKLPAGLNAEMAQRITDCFNSEDIQGQMDTLTVIVDSLMREEKTHVQSLSSWLDGDQGSVLSPNDDSFRSGDRSYFSGSQSQYSQGGSIESGSVGSRSHLSGSDRGASPA
ncbi:expressed unknown protein [Seminavis robusta]|uniref:ZZ-type domain-containing protein n=1 Tax=Seminavis robusta TaxID=568900 RepID=A0A9N8HDF2_9STRA|nr:expressed unknown protein [Seminavis robusta]|eukprot:Sro457_g146900.1 n/a (1370) ;mRNA; f:41951-46060